MSGCAASCDSLPKGIARYPRYFVGRPVTDRLKIAPRHPRENSNKDAAEELVRRATRRIRNASAEHNARAAGDNGIMRRGPSEYPD